MTNMPHVVTNFFLYHNSSQSTKRPRGRPHKSNMLQNQSQSIPAMRTQNLHDQVLSSCLIEPVLKIPQRYAT